jgi:hypothetical protein
MDFRKDSLFWRGLAKSIRPSVAGEVCRSAIVSGEAA